MSTIGALPVARSWHLGGNDINNVLCEPVATVFRVAEGRKLDRFFFQVLAKRFLQGVIVAAGTCRK